MDPRYEKMKEARDAENVRLYLEWESEMHGRAALAATDPAFEQAAMRLAEALGVECERALVHEGVNIGFHYVVEGKAGRALVSEWRPKLEAEGHRLFQIWEERGRHAKDCIMLVPDLGPLGALAIMCTSAMGTRTSSGLTITPRLIVAQLAVLHRRHPFDPIFVRHDRIEARFESPLTEKDMGDVSTCLNELGPDELELSEERFFLWWD